MRSSPLAWLVLSVVLTAGCGTEAPEPVERVPLHVAGVRSPTVDLLFVVDNSGSMAQEQAVLAASMPLLLTELMDPPDEDGDGRPDRIAVRDLNVGVVSTDMGTGGFRVSTCPTPTGGDRGCLLHAPSSTVTGCASSYPLFLSRYPANAASYPIATMAQDFGCLASLGTQGCGFEQQLFAARDAVTTNAAAGGCNAGFLRDWATLVIVWVTDENDCSVPPESSSMFDPDRTDLGHLNIRCFVHPDMIEPILDIAGDLRSAKPSGADTIVLGMIVGVPPDVPACAGSGADMAACLADAGMAEQIDPSMPTQLIPSCDTDMGWAFPPRRMVELAQEFGDAAVVGSICQDDWSAVMTGIAERTAARLPMSSCLSGNAQFNPITSGDPSDDCWAECLAVETLADDGACLEDEVCPAAWCPDATLDDVRTGRVPNCADPATGLACSPLERDLGLDELGHRQCLLRQSRRSLAIPGGDCSYVRESGWNYVPAVWSRQDPQCSEVEFPPIDGRAQVEESSTVTLYCVPEECPEALRCGPASEPASLCCFPSMTCLGGGGAGQGTCCHTEHVCDRTCCGVLEECCDGTCCNSDEQCLPAYDSPTVRGCCPVEQWCGETCCRPGQYCSGGWMCTT